MLQPPEPSQELVRWLAALRLSQYTSCFHEAGYQSLEDCRALTDDLLLGLNVLSARHRRRILRSLEAVGLKAQTSGGCEEDNDRRVQNLGSERKPVPYPRNVFIKRFTVFETSQTEQGRHVERSQTLPPGAGPGINTDDPPQPAPRNAKNMGATTPDHLRTPMSVTSSSSGSLSVSEAPSDSEADSSGRVPHSSSPVVPAPAEGPVPVTAEDHSYCQGEAAEGPVKQAQARAETAEAPLVTCSVPPSCGCACKLHNIIVHVLCFTRSDKSQQRNIYGL
ncbi:arf-GAP with Rho-GAP domain, ANK repeat and PH domain-containing protein 1-like isoform X1 [Betta splendens]|uniref:Arf-GAP with Rho-GAP domain, ANK repeat and PH domain-containing protein 1-like isoform X1 n=1 Tax=Betta splendens TaxID=158456 RepID=A0A9W2XN24_BETSP|nr:arf-GAP with Rho-GAP domain, ANK repeat and PH domain-containing protein 1-like isoform X1 [Betta splendens]XP_055363032.1 arf-GAP with Rho-GAP domain, ANK repeat and PH domain-containing protein 1-like isoform X1 [Betta splendens]